MVSERTKEARVQLEDCIEQDFNKQQMPGETRTILLEEALRIEEMDLLSLCAFYCMIMPMLVSDEQATSRQENIKTSLDRFVVSTIHDASAPQEIFRGITT